MQSLPQERMLETLSGFKWVNSSINIQSFTTESEIILLILFFCTNLINSTDGPVTPEDIQRFCLTDPNQFIV